MLVLKTTSILKSNLLVAWENQLKLSADWDQQCTQMWSSFTKKIQSLNFSREIQFRISTNFCLSYFYAWEFLCRIFIESPTHTNSWMSAKIVFPGKIHFPGFLELSHKYSLMGYAGFFFFFFTLMYHSCGNFIYVMAY